MKRKRLSLKNKHVLVTRPEKESEGFAENLQLLGAKISFFPTIMTAKNNLSVDMKNKLGNLNLFDWVIFTSINGIIYLFEHLKDMNMDMSILRTKKIGVVGPETAKMAQSYKLPVHFMPSQYSTQKISEEIPDILNTNILLPRSDIANPKLVSVLRNRGAKVVNIPVYQTRYLPEANHLFEDAIETPVDYISFTSPSCVTGFLGRVSDKKLMQTALQTTVLSIGPVTTEAAKKAGFEKIVTADIFNTQGMIKKLEQVAL